jgi:ATP-binding cassette, subfamily C, bacteriocin exporter
MGNEGGRLMWTRYAMVRQADSSDCGAAALATVARHYRQQLSLPQLRELTGTDRSGTTLRGLADAAERLGFAARGVRGTYETLPALPLPAVAHVKNAEGLGHFVVLHRVTSTGVVLADPGQGIEKVAREEFCRRWTGHLLLLVPDALASRDAGAAQAAQPAGPGRRLLGLLRGHVRVLAEACACALLVLVLGMATSFFLQHLVDGVLVRQEGRLLNALGVGMVLLVLFGTLFGVLRQYLLAHVARHLDLSLLAGFARHLLRLPVRFFETRQVGDILARAFDTFKVREAVSGTLTTAVVDGMLVVLLLGVLWLYDGPVALVASAFVPVLFLVVALHHPAARRRARASMEQASLFYSHLAEDVAGVETVKAFGAERSRCEEGENRLVRYLQELFGQQLVGLSMEGLSLLVTALAGVVILWYGGHRVMAGALTVGQLLFCYSLLIYLLEPLRRLASVAIKLQDALSAVDRLYQVLDLETEPLNDPGKVSCTGLRTALELHDVSFRYGSRGTVLDQINLRIPAGQTVAIVGESGSGKSTLLKLLQGFYQPTEGRMQVDGVDVRDLDLASYRRRIGMVAQDPQVFTGTMRDNIALGRPGATLAEVMAAARAAGLDEFIAGLPERYQTVLGERGANMSGGQRQRLAIARALLRQPELLIFDEATSHLDTATERAIQANLQTALAGKTAVLVAHRLSTVREADYIYVLQAGRIAEEGTHRELLDRQGWYAALWQHQTEDGEPVPASGLCQDTLAP